MPGPGVCRLVVPRADLSKPRLSCRVPVPVSSAGCRCPLMVPGASTGAGQTRKFGAGCRLVLFYHGFLGFLKTCVQSKMFFSETKLSVLKTVRAFEKQYLRSAFLNFKRLCYFCFKVRMFDFTSKSRFSQKKNPPPFGSQMGGGSAKKSKIRVFMKKKLVLS